jgi:F-type H+-transporting ATPase subunit gamma
MTKMPRYGVDKAMKDRINSVSKTGKLTDAMRLVAAAKVRKAQDGVTKSRPFSDELQSMIKGLVKKLKGSGLEQELPMLRVPEKVNNVGILMVNSNRGLCGAYNSFVQKKVKARVEELNAQGIVPKLFLVGRKATASLTAKLAPEAGVKLNYTKVFFTMPDSITSAKSSEIGDQLRSYFLSGEVDKVEVVYKVQELVAQRAHAPDPPAPVAHGHRERHG